MHCPDKKGIIAAVTNFIHQQNGNIVYIDQYVDRNLGAFFMRVVVEGAFDNSKYTQLKAAFIASLGQTFQLNCSFYLEEKLPKLAVFVSKYDHCLYDILSQQRSGKLTCTIPFICSNHPDLHFIAEQFNIPFFHIPVSKENKAAAEQKQLEILKQFEIDCIVLARYMQIITSKIIDAYPHKIINIHHSFFTCISWSKTLSFSL